MYCSHPAGKQRTTGEARHPARVAAPLLALLVGALTGCGGRVTGDEATIHGPPTQDGGASQGEGGVLIGVGGFPVIVGQGGTYAGVGGMSGQAGGAAEECEVSKLWRLVDFGPAVSSKCSPELCAQGWPVRGSVTLDATGAVVANTAWREDEEEWEIERLADWRWPCLAGQTIEYCCDGGV